MDTRHTLAPAFCEEKSFTNTGTRVCRIETDFLQRKRHRAFFQLRLVALAKLRKIEVDFAHNHGTVPRRHEGVFPFEAICLAKVRVALQKKVTSQPKVPANKANEAELESCVFIEIGCACEGIKAATVLRQPFQPAYLRALAVSQFVKIP